MSGISQKVMSVLKGPEGAWDLSFAYYTGPFLGDVSTAIFSANLIFGGLDTSPRNLFIKPDGTKIYVIGDATDAVYEFDLSTPWAISSRSYLQNFSVSSQETQPSGIFFKPDGSKMYIVGLSGRDVNEYDLSTAWDVSSASFLQSFSVISEDLQPRAVFFKPDGTKMYVLGTTGDDVNEYDLSTAWDVSSASYLQNFSVAAQETQPTGLAFLSDGTKMYVLGSSGDDVNEYDLSTAWDVSSASFVQTFSVNSQDTTPYGLFFKPDGGIFYITGDTNDRVYQYTLGGFSVSAQELTPEQVFFKPDGMKMYVIGSNLNGSLNEYDLSTAWDVSTASFLQLFDISTQDTNPRGLFFKPDGTKMYVLGGSGDDVNEYDLSTAWDISSASYLQNFSVSGQESGPEGLFFKPDGTKMYITGVTGDDVNEYDLSTAWDISTASFLQLFDVSAQSTQPTELFFKPDGKKMYVLNYTGSNAVLEYDLSTAWDISSASYVQNFDVSNQTTARRGLFFKPDGTKMYVVDIIVNDLILTYTLGPQD